MLKESDPAVVHQLLGQHTHFNGVHQGEGCTELSLERAAFSTYVMLPGEGASIST